MGHRTSHLQGSKQEEIRIVAECHVVLLSSFSFEDSQLNNGRRINRSSVSRGYMISVNDNVKMYFGTESYTSLLIRMLSHVLVVE
jgi:hypothetical protein